MPHPLTTAYVNTFILVHMVLGILMLQVGLCIVAVVMFRYEEDMDERLDVSIRRIVQQNKRTSMELQLHVEESSMLQQENKILSEERRKLQRACFALCTAASDLLEQCA